MPRPGLVAPVREGTESPPGPIPPTQTTVDLRAGLRSSPPEGPPLWINECFESAGRVATMLLPSRVSPYWSFGIFGMFVGFCAAFGASLWVGLPLWVLICCAATSLASFVVLGQLRQRRFGWEKHVLLEDLLAALTMTALVAAAFGVSVAHALDVMTVGLGVFLVFGRLGCFFVGCCHGRPSLVGTKYTQRSHVGRPFWGLRLFPVQLVELAWIAAATCGALFWLGIRTTPATTTCWFLGAYCSGRFVLEWLRGDRSRRMVGPLSETQWLSLAVGVLVTLGWDTVRAISADSGVWRAPVGVVMVVGMVLLAYKTRNRWFSGPQSEVRPDTVARWRLRLGDLHARANAVPGSTAKVFSPEDRWEISLSDDTADQNLRLWSYTLQPGPAWSDGRARMNDFGGSLQETCGMLLQRMPPHRVLRFQRQQPSGAVQLWVLVDAEKPGMESPEDDPRQICDRAFAFSCHLQQ